MRLPIFTLILILNASGLGRSSGLAQSAPGPNGLANVTIPAGSFKLIANPFFGGNIKLAQFLPRPAEGTEFYKVVNGEFRTNKFHLGAWTNPDETLEPGEGAVIFNRGSVLFQVTFQGTVPQGTLKNTIPAGLSIKSSLVPQTGYITSTLGLNLSPFDNVYQWKNNRLEVYTFLPDGTWIPSEPVLGIAEACFIRADRGATWERTFNINQ